MSRSGRRSRSSSSSSSAAVRCWASVASGSAASAARRARSSSTRSPSSGRAATARSSSRPAARERLVHARQHPPQPVAPVGREQLEPLRIVPGAELGERLAERLRAEHGRLRLVELAEARVEPGGERIRPEEAGTEAVDRRDPGAVELAREVVPAALGEGGADPRPQLARRAARVRDDEDRVDVEPALCDRTDDPLDEHGRLAGAGAGRDEDLAPRLDRGELLMVQLKFSS